jgi:hypothetical protein
LFLNLFYKIWLLKWFIVLCFIFLENRLGLALREIWYFWGALEMEWRLLVTWDLLNRILSIILRGIFDFYFNFFEVRLEENSKIIIIDKIDFITIYISVGHCKFRREVFEDGLYGVWELGVGCNIFDHHHMDLFFVDNFQVHVTLFHYLLCNYYIIINVFLLN